MGRTFEAARERRPRQMTVAFREEGTGPGLNGPRSDIVDEVRRVWTDTSIVC